MRSVNLNPDDFYVQYEHMMSSSGLMASCRCKGLEAEAAGLRKFWGAYEPPPVVVPKISPLCVQPWLSEDYQLHRLAIR